MDNTKKLSDLMINLMKRAEKLPPEKQLRLMWVMISALIFSLDQYREYQEAGLNAIVKYVEDCGKAEERALLARTAIEKKLAEAILGSEELFS